MLNDCSIILLSQHHSLSLWTWDSCSWLLIQKLWTQTGSSISFLLLPLVQTDFFYLFFIFCTSYLRCVSATQYTMNSKPDPAAQNQQTSALILITSGGIKYVASGDTVGLWWTYPLRSLVGTFSWTLRMSLFLMHCAVQQRYCFSKHPWEEVISLPSIFETVKNSDTAVVCCLTLKKTWYRANLAESPSVDLYQIWRNYSKGAIDESCPQKQVGCT